MSWYEQQQKEENSEKRVKPKQENETSSIFRVRVNWDDAVKYTDEGLAPLAVMLIPVVSLPDIDAELWEGHYPHTVVAMTTRFTDPEVDKKLGWYVLEGELRQNIAQLLYDNVWPNEWVCLSQEFVTGENDE